MQEEATVVVCGHHRVVLHIANIAPPIQKF